MILQSRYMESKVKILHSNNRVQDDLSLAKLVNFLGRDYEFLYYHDYIAYTAASSEATNNDILALSCNTLFNIQNDQRLYENFKSLMGTRISFVFIYGISSCTSVNDALYSISEGTIKSVCSLSSNEYEYDISEGFTDICRQFSGLRFGPISNKVDFSLELEDKVNKIDNLITIDRKPLFLRLKKNDCQIFIAATSNLVDIQGTTYTNISVVDIFSGLIPALMFLKYVFKDYCWHNNTAQGCFIIDDPPLKRKYGFLNYGELFEVMELCNFHTSIAFIPWNFKRSSRGVTDLFKNKSNRFSICVHGCDHNGGEFGSVDCSKLDFQVKIATSRMIFHKDINGLEFDRVMVFPQEVFSSKSLMVLKSNNYLAAVNSGIISCDNSEPVSIESLLQPALIEYENFPIFQRRTPKKIADFALDLFLGKPILIFEHHDYFRNGYSDLKEFIIGLNNLVDKIEWKRLEEIITSSYLQKNDESHIAKIKLYTNKILINNPSDDVQTYEIIKKETGNVSVSSVIINGEKVPYNICDKILTMFVNVKPGEIAEIVIGYKDQFPQTRHNTSIIYKMKVLIRRYLSEFRDNYISKNTMLYSLSQRIVRFCQ